MANKGIMVKVWNIHGSSSDGGGKSIATQLSDSIKYIENSEKTTAYLDDAEDTFFDTAEQIERECKYAANDLKTMDGAYIGSRHLMSDTIDGMVKEFLEVKEFFNKTDGRCAVHGVISLPIEESDISNASNLMALCEDVLAKIFPNNQVIFAVHTNTDNLHIHFIVNTVGLDGKKIHESRNFVKDILQPTVNQFALQYGFTPNEKWENKDLKQTRIDNFIAEKEKLRNLIDTCIESSNNLEEFADLLRKENITVNIGKHISIQTADMYKAIRSHNLGANYSKENIIHRIETRKEAFQDISNIVTNHTINREISNISFVNAGISMKKFKDMDKEEKKYIIRELKLGHNPWKAFYDTKWQLSAIADSLNRQHKAENLIEYYSENGSAQSAIQTIINLKQEISEQKKFIRQQLNEHKPEIEIYDEMKELAPKSYLYEYEHLEAYKPYYDRYLELTRRLKNGYNKDVNEIAEFVKSCEEQLLYAAGQLKELSDEYRTIKNYAREKNMSLDVTDSLYNACGITDTRNRTKERSPQSNTSYLVSAKNPDIYIKVVTSAATVNGKIVEKHEMSVLNGYGEIITKSDSVSDENYNQFIKEVEQNYQFSKVRRFQSIYDARTYMGACKQMNNENKENEKIVEPEKKDIEQNEKTVYSFFTGVNLSNVKGQKEGFNVLVDKKRPNFIAVVSTAESSIQIRVMDADNQLLEQVDIPRLENRTKDGFETLCYLKNKYDFEDMYDYKTIQEAKSYIEQVHNSNQQTNVQTKLR